MNRFTVFGMRMITRFNKAPAVPMVVMKKKRKKKNEGN